MGNIKIYKITFWNIVKRMIPSLIILAVILLPFFLIDFNFTGGSLISVIIAWLFFSCYGIIYPLYVCIIYYKLDKNLEIEINFDKNEISFSKDTSFQIIKFEDIKKVFAYSLGRINFWYYEIKCIDGKSITVNCLVIQNLEKIVEKSRREIVSDQGIIPLEWKKKRRKQKLARQNEEPLHLSKWQYALIYSAILLLVGGLFYLVFRK